MGKSNQYGYLTGFSIHICTFITSKRSLVSVKVWRGVYHKVYQVLQLQAVANKIITKSRGLFRTLSNIFWFFKAAFAFVNIKAVFPFFLSFFMKSQAKLFQKIVVTVFFEMPLFPVIVV